ncbi:hypothetical protein D3C75_1133500 [compost metagenome]
MPSLPELLTFSILAAVSTNSSSTCTASTLMVGAWPIAYCPVLRMLGSTSPVTHCLNPFAAGSVLPKIKA